MTDKRSLRREFTARRAAIAPEARRRMDAALRCHIEALAAWRECRAVALYATDGTEPDLMPLMAAAGKVFLLPRYVAAMGEYEFAVTASADELTPGRYGLPEPRPECPAAEPELVRRRTLHLVPGVAFDRHGTRLGRGGGFYDRLLEGVTSPVWGVFYTGQQAERLPVESHDRRLDGVVTEEGMLDFHEKHDF